jgi:hypothetical protein
MGMLTPNPGPLARQGETHYYISYICFPENMYNLTDHDDSSVMGIFWKCARIGERLSPYISICCLLMAVSALCSIVSISPCSIHVHY